MRMKTLCKRQKILFKTCSFSIVKISIVKCLSSSSLRDQKLALGLLDFRVLYSGILEYESKSSTQVQIKLKGWVLGYLGSNLVGIIGF